MITHKEKTLGEYEAEIRKAAGDTPGVTFGYIGNFERWGDDRCLYLWIQKREANGNQAHLWRGAAIQLNRREVASAKRALHLFKLGYEAAPAPPVTVLFEHPGSSGHYDNAIWCASPCGLPSERGKGIWLTPGQSLAVIQTPTTPK